MVDCHTHTYTHIHTHTHTQDGMVDCLKIKHKDNQKGIGFEGHDDTWLAHQDDFQVRVVTVTVTVTVSASGFMFYFVSVCVGCAECGAWREGEGHVGDREEGNPGGNLQEIQAWQDSKILVWDLFSFLQEASPLPEVREG